MFSGKEAANPAYPTQWALNPTAYQNVDANSVDWACLAQQWIAMKEAAAIISAPPPPSTKPDAEEGEAPMEVEHPDNTTESSGPPGAEWNAATNSWGGGWNQWGWNHWSSGSGADPKIAGGPPVPMMDGYSAPTDNTAPIPGFASGPTPTFQHGYWTASQGDQGSGRGASRTRDRSKSNNRDHHKTTRNRPQREKLPGIPPAMAAVAPTPVPGPTIDAAKRRQLPAWIREGLEKMEREKQRAIEREEEKKARDEAEKEKKRLEEEELERLKAEAGGQPMLPAKSKFDTDSEGESDRESAPAPAREAEAVSEESQEEARPPREAKDDPPLVKRSREEIMQEVMLTVRRSLTEILLEVTDQEIHMVSQEEWARYNAAQASRLNAMKASKSKALAAIASGLGLGAYESSSDESADDEEGNDVTDYQLQDMIRRKKHEFERTSREIEAEVRRAELREAGEDAPTPVATPERPRRSRSSATPPPADSDTPDKLPERRPSNDKRNNHKPTDKPDGVRRLDSVHEEKAIKSIKRERSPSAPKTNKINQKENSSSTSDSEADSSSSSNNSSAESEPKVKAEPKDTKKRKRRSSSSDGSLRKSKKDKHKKEPRYKSIERNSYSKSKYDEYERSDRMKPKKKDSYYDKHKSSRSRDYDRSHKDKYRDESDDDRSRKRSKRSRSFSYESRTRRRASRERSRRRERTDERSRERERERERERDKHDRYERARDERRRTRSRSRHRR